MDLRFLTASALAAAVAVGCATQETGGKSDAAAAKPAKPALMTGASDEMLATTCFGCHGTQGYSNGPATPTIAGLEADYLQEVMEDYRDGERVSTIMNRIAKGYSDKEIEQLAAYFSRQQFRGRIQTSAGAKARKGKELHEAYCEKCHEDGGTSVEDTPLAGQWMPYVQWTITDYLNGHNAPEKKMKKAIDKMLAEHAGMTKAQIAEYLSHFYGSR